MLIKDHSPSVWHWSHTIYKGFITLVENVNFTFLGVYVGALIEHFLQASVILVYIGDSVALNIGFITLSYFSIIYERDYLGIPSVR